MGGLCLARGYLNSPELTKRYFVVNAQGQRLYKTGDLCRRSADGVFECIGRIDYQFKIRGFRVEPDEIEVHLATHPAIKRAAVVVRSDYQKEKCLVAYYVLKNTKKKCAA